jgi:glycosyltransferase involved in cell wall biosynthesis
MKQFFKKLSDKIAVRLYHNPTFKKLKDIPAYLQHRHHYAAKRKVELLVLDDIFPSLLSAFRIAEINAYFRQFDTLVLSTANSFQYINEKRSFEEVLAEYRSHYPEGADRILFYNYFAKVDPQLVYIVFLHNAYYFLNYIEKLQKPFVFTLYPGGGFELNNPHIDHMLRTVMGSPYFREVIVTQKITRDYLIEHNFCDAAQINFIFGVVLPIDNFLKLPAKKLKFPEDKYAMDVCFVAVKLMPRGVDKGYDTFIESAKLLCRQHENIRFHVVGNYSPADIDISEIADRITFYGYLGTHQFTEFYRDKDIIISPNVPFKLTKGGFDGFPTGACVEASLNNVAMVVTDPLQMNNGIYEDGQDIVFVQPDPSEIAAKVLHYVHNPDRLYALALAGMEKNRRIFALENQVSPRIEILKKYIAQQHDQRDQAISAPARRV